MSKITVVILVLILVLMFIRISYPIREMNSGDMVATYDPIFEKMNEKSKELAAELGGYSWWNIVHIFYLIIIGSIFILFDKNIFKK